MKLSEFAACLRRIVQKLEGEGIASADDLHIKRVYIFNGHNEARPFEGVWIDFREGAPVASARIDLCDMIVECVFPGDLRRV